MRNPHLLSDGWKTRPINGKDGPGNKKYKRKARDPKHLSEVKSFKHDSRTDDDSMGELMEETFRNSAQKRLQEPSTDVSLGNSIISSPNPNTAIDMRINAVPTVTGKLESSQSRSLSEPTTRDTYHTTFPQVTSYDYQQSFGSDHTLQSRIVLCQRSERSLSSASQASYSNNSSEPAESPRKRLGETSGVVTEIKAVQQTRRLLANARERTRVHTISAAFEALRKQVFPLNSLNTQSAQ